MELAFRFTMHVSAGTPPPHRRVHTAHAHSLSLSLSLSHTHTHTHTHVYTYTHALARTHAHTQVYKRKRAHTHTHTPEKNNLRNIDRTCRHVSCRVLFRRDSVCGFCPTSIAHFVNHTTHRDSIRYHCVSSCIVCADIWLQCIIYGTAEKVTGLCRSYPCFLPVDTF